MQTVALILQDHTVYYSGAILVLAAFSAVFLALALCAARGKEANGLLRLMVLSLLLSLPLSRLVHWYCNAEQYVSLGRALIDYTTGGYSPLGVFAAVLLSALLLRACRLLDDLPALLDCLAPAGALGMAVGRMSCLFSSANRSKFTLADSRFRRLPFMVSAPIASGGVEWRIATFALEALAAAVICVVLLLCFRRLCSEERFLPRWKDGNVFFLFLALYSAVNVVLDSTRYDALYLRSNGFVSVTQICCAAALLFTTVLYSVRSVRACGLRVWHFGVWLLWAASAGLGGYMEYVVQRHADRFLSAYSVMESCFLLLFLLCCVLCTSTRQAVVEAIKARQAARTEAAEARRLAREARQLARAEAAKARQHARAEVPEPARRPRTGAPEPARRPRTGAPEPVRRPPTGAPEPARRPRTGAPEPARRPRTGAPEPVRRPRTGAPEPARRPRTGAPEPVRRPPTEASKPRRSVPASAATGGEPGRFPSEAPAGVPGRRIPADAASVKTRGNAMQRDGAHTAGQDVRSPTGRAKDPRTAAPSERQRKTVTAAGAPNAKLPASRTNAPARRAAPGSAAGAKAKNASAPGSAVKTRDASRPASAAAPRKPSVVSSFDLDSILAEFRGDDNL